MNSEKEVVHEWNIDRELFYRVLEDGTVEYMHEFYDAGVEIVRMAARIEKLEAVRDAAIKMRGLKFNGAWLPTIPTLEEFDAALAADRGEEAE